MLQGEMVLRVWDVEHGACAMMHHQLNGQAGRLALIDHGCTKDWRPSDYIRQQLNRTNLEYLFITNADQDHMSDLKGLEDAGVNVPVRIRNPTYTGQQMAQIKAVSGPLTRDATWYVNACGSYNQPVTEPFNTNMGGITATLFFNPYPRFVKTNDLSLVVFIQYDNFKILFPDDLEVAGWRALLADPTFRAELASTNILDWRNAHRRRNQARAAWRSIPASDTRISVAGGTGTIRSLSQSGHRFPSLA
jgi:beta-lactamase superfamily II metal-dependent hydrolase